jgi:hypothetical protein
MEEFAAKSRYKGEVQKESIKGNRRLGLGITHT